MGDATNLRTAAREFWNCSEIIQAGDECAHVAGARKWRTVRTSVGMLADQKPKLRFRRRNPPAPDQSGGGDGWIASNQTNY